MKPLLLIAHPGHELRIFEWVRRTVPHVVVLTNGDGSIGQPRLTDTQQLLARVHVRLRSDWFRPVADSVVYQALLEGDASLFQLWLEQLTQAGLDGQFDTVVADEAEGYNPTHDLCRALANCLAQRLEHAGRRIRSLEFPLVGHPCDPARHGQAEVEITLSATELEQKLTLMKDYAGRCSAVLVRELQTMLDTYGAQAFGKECLYRASTTPYEVNELPGTTPFFERAGEERKRAGIYEHVIRAEHLRHLVQKATTISLKVDQ